MAGTEAADDDVERIGELRTKLLLPPAAFELKHQQRQQRATEQGCTGRLE
jgi:hypothetical protein